MGSLRLIAAFLLIFCITGCDNVPVGGSEKSNPAKFQVESASPAEGDSIIVSSIGDARSLLPILASDSASGDICGLIYNGLVKYDKNINIVGDLAESWEIQDGGLVIIFHLRKNVLWHDGTPFTAKDVEFTYKKLVDPAIKTPYSGDFERIKSLEVTDDYTIKVTYKEVFAPSLASWGMGIMPKHLLENEDLNNTKYSRNPIGTGPYKFKRWLTADRIELVANDKYFEGRPYIDKYIYRIIPDQATIFLELETEGVDYAGLTPLQYQRQTDTNYFRSHYQKFRYPSFGYTYLGYNLNNPKFKDKEVRKAIDYAINKKELIDGVLLGCGAISTGPFPQESWAYNELVAPLPFDPEKAKDLLKEAGFADANGDGWLEKDGAPFEFEIITNQGNNERKLTAEIIQRRLKEVGIKVKIKIVEWSVFITEFINKRNFEAVILGWSLSRDPDCYDIWHSSKTKEGEFNFIGYSNPEVDMLLVQGRGTFDMEERKKVYKRIHEILHEDEACTFLYTPDALPVVHKRFHGIEPSPIGIGYNFIKWHVPKNAQKYITK